MEKKLNPEQIELLRLTALGMNHREIATLLKQDPEYMRWLLRAAREALGARSMPQAMVIAYERGILPMTETDNKEESDD